MKLEFSREFLEKNPQISNFTKVRPVGAELFQWADITKLIAVFRKIPNTPENPRTLR
jgi:hypothetical protein